MANNSDSFPGNGSPATSSFDGKHNGSTSLLEETIQKKKKKPKVRRVHSACRGGRR